ncbi:unnamed protein product [Miscanthus lutarioriparius]|uniref:Uncharacterized protein n=1 Tax=Miscanthus lutarioriparius TaxID=422564 RepID=A0A811SSM7_9POAL|nr:unnamed protein product [Miscanthus lutarioriparius]
MAAQHCGIEGRGEVRDGRGREGGRGAAGGPLPGAAPGAGGGGMSARRPELHSILAPTSQNLLETYQLFRAIDALSNLVQESPQFNQRVRSLIQERGLNLDNNLEKPGETSWGSYYEALVKLAAYLPAVCDALDFMGRDDSKRTDEKLTVLRAQWAFTEDMPFVLLLMRDVLATTNQLSLALDRNDLDAENFMILLKESKRQLLALRDEGWPSFLMEVDLLCA